MTDVGLALYRKYRPRSFAEVIGQDHVTEPLIQALRNDRLNHAYLFSGPRGCGKTSSARILARSLNCAKGPTPTPCGECDSCRALAPDGPGSIDVIEIDAASHGGVDDARELRERAFFTPAISRFKIYIIDEAHMVSTAGFNALLKLVEEPPDYVKFVFATTEPEKVLGTIKSRTHHYPFRLIPPGVLRPYLEQLAEAEGVAVEAPVFPLVVRAGGGSARDTLSVLDQLIAGSGPEGVTYARAVALLGVTDVALIDDMIDALAASDGSAAFATIDRVAEAGHDARRFSSDLLQRLRDLIILRQLPEAVEKGLLDAPDDELARMKAQAGQIGEGTLSRYADIVHNGLVEMRGAASPRLLLELVTARMLLPAVDESVSALLQRLERLERGAPPASSPAGSSGSGHAAARQVAARASAASPPEAPPSPAPSTSEQSTPKRQAMAVAEAPVAPPPRSPKSDDGWPETAVTGAVPAPVAAPAAVEVATAGDGSGIDAQTVRRTWDEIVRMVGQNSKKAAAFAREAVVREIEGQTLVLVFKHKIHADGVTNEPGPLLDAVRQVLGGVWSVRCEVGGDQRKPPPPPVAAPPAPPAPAKAVAPRRAAVVATAAEPAPKDDEVPYDPEFDGAPRAVAATTREGFDPGDEPDLDTDSLAVRQSSEEQALDSLRKSFDIEKIAEHGR